jgi:hypothetical protein
LTALPLILAVTAAATPFPFADGPPWDAAYSDMGEALTAEGWEVRGDGETLFAFAGPLELTLRWDEDGFLASVTAVERWGDDEEAGRAFDARFSDLSAVYGEPLKTEGRYALWEVEGYDVVLETDHIFSSGGKVSVVMVRYLRDET